MFTMVKLISHKVQKYDTEGNIESIGIMTDITQTIGKGTAKRFIRPKVLICQNHPSSIREIIYNRETTVK